MSRESWSSLVEKVRRGGSAIEEVAIVESWALGMVVVGVVVAPEIAEVEVEVEAASVTVS